MIHRRWLTRLASLFLPLCAWAAGSACSSGGGGRLGDASVQDTLVLDFAFGDLPAGCPPSVPNNRGVGKACSVKGGECGSGLACTCDNVLGIKGPPDTPCFCTIPSLMDCPQLPAGYCGTGATCCSYMGLASLCVPDVCLPAAACPAF